MEIYMEIYAIIGVDGQLGYKSASLSRLNSVKRLCKPNFLTVAAKAAA
jgi:hypothetical protein